MGFVKNPVNIAREQHGGLCCLALACACAAMAPRHSLWRLHARCLYEDSHSTIIITFLQISTVNMGLAVGWSCAILAFGKKGWRKSLPHSLGEDGAIPCCAHMQYYKLSKVSCSQRLLLL
jgi:hypothetical protein